MTPLELNICLHYHSSVVDMEWIDSGAPIVDETMRSLVSDGLLLRRDGPITDGFMRYTPTPRLHAFVAMMESLPLPCEVWYDPLRRKIISGDVCSPYV